MTERKKKTIEVPVLRIDGTQNSIEQKRLQELPHEQEQNTVERGIFAGRPERVTVVKE